MCVGAAEGGEGRPQGRGRGEDWCVVCNFVSSVAAEARSTGNAVLRVPLHGNRGVRGLG